MVRHGQSLYQSLKIVSGMNEFGLSGLGKAQSKSLGKKLSRIRFDSAYSSDFKRCVESYEILEQELKHKPNKVYYTPTLRERDPGSDLLKSYTDVYHLQQSAARENNAETSEKIQQRAKIFFDQIISDFFQQQSFQNLELEQAICQQVQAHQTFNQQSNIRSLNQQTQLFCSSAKNKYTQNILAITHAGFIAEALGYLFKKQNTPYNELLFSPAIYARNSSLFLIQIEVEDNQNWKHSIDLKNYNRNLNAPFDSIC